MSTTERPVESSPELIYSDGEQIFSEHAEDGQETRDPVVAAIPAYNEELSIGTIVLLVLEYVDEVVVVDDGSTDRTADVARNAGAIVLEHEENRGKGAAVQSLIDFLKGRGVGACVFFDGDGQHAPSDIPRVVEPVVDGEADLVIGSRFVEGGSTENIPIYRRFGQRVLDAVTALPSGTKLTDTQSGFRALSPDALRVMSTSAQGFGIESEMIDIASREELSVLERPINVHYNDVDSTLNPIRHGFQVFRFNLKLLRDRNPLLYFGGTGVVLTVVGTVSLLEAFTTSAVGTPLDQTRMVVAQLVLIAGVLCLFAGIVVDAIGVEETTEDGS